MQIDRLCLVISTTLHQWTDLHYHTTSHFHMWHYVNHGVYAAACNPTILVLAHQNVLWKLQCFNPHLWLHTGGMWKSCILQQCMAIVQGLPLLCISGTTCIHWETGRKINRCIFSSHFLHSFHSLQAHFFINLKYSCKYSCTLMASSMMTGDSISPKTRYCLLYTSDAADE